MKIILIGPAHPYRGGLASYNERLARALMDAGHSVTIYTFTLQYPGFLFPGKTQFSSSPPPQGLDIRRKINSINPLNWMRVGHELRKAKPDLLLYKYWLPFMGPCFAKIAAITKRNRHTKAIAILDNLIPHEKRTGDKLFTKWFVKRMDGFVAQSQSVLDDLVGLLSAPKSTVIANETKWSEAIPSTDADSEIASPHSLRESNDKTIQWRDKAALLSPHPLFDNFGSIIPKEEAKKLLGLDPNFGYVLFFGFIRAYKGLDLLLEAWADERIANLPLKLLIAGEYYESADKYKKLISDLNLSDRVIERNAFIADEEVHKYFSASDLLVQPYRHATQSGVAQIGYHFNKPMIVTNVGGLPEIVPHNKVGYVVKVDPRDIADHIVKFYSERKEAEFSANAAEEKKKYSWEKMVDGIERVYGAATGAFGRAS